jgi:hypothetical protein
MDPLPPPAAAAAPVADVRIERSVAPISFPDPTLEAVLHGQLFPPGTTPEACMRQGGVRYVFNRFDLDGDRQPETLVALLGQKRCTSRGCPLLLLRSMGDQLIPLQMIEGFHHTLVVSEHRNQGWLDLILPREPADAPAPPRVLVHTGARYPGVSPLEGDRLALSTRGTAALVVKASPYLVQGHPLSCPPVKRDQRNRVLSRVPTARPTSSPPLGAAVGGASRPEPTVWVATKLMSPQRKMPVTP